MPLLLLIPLVITILCLSYIEKEGGLLVLAAIFGGLWASGLLGDFATFVYTNPQTFAIYTLAYLVAGFSWSVFKWAKLFLDKNGYALKKIAKEYNKSIKEVYNTYLEQYGDSSIKNSDLTPYQRTVLQNISRLNLSDHVASISSWIICWPLSILFYIIGDLFVDFTKLVIRLFRKVYDKAVSVAVGLILR